jgi:2-isopropylmalate synthase
MALSVRSANFQCTSNVTTTRLCAASRELCSIIGLTIAPNKAIVGSNAFAHEAGIHQHGVLKNPLTYEIMTPESVGARTDRFVFGRHSGHHALHALLHQNGIELDRKGTAQLLATIKDRAEQVAAVPLSDILASGRALAARANHDRRLPDRSSQAAP